MASMEPYVSVVKSMFGEIAGPVCLDFFRFLDSEIWAATSYHQMRINGSRENIIMSSLFFFSMCCFITGLLYYT